MKKLFFLLLAQISVVAYAQVSLSTLNQNGSYGIIYHHAKILKHSPKILTPIAPSSYAIQLKYSKDTYGNKDWQKMRHYPTIGASLWYTHYDENYLGSAVSGSIDFTKKLLKTKYGYLHFTSQFGAGYLSKKYDRLNDSLNNIIGSSVNLFAGLHLGASIILTPHWNLNIGTSFTHHSNGRSRLPNFGVNMYSAHIGLMYSPQATKIKPNTQPYAKRDNKYTFVTRLGTGKNESNAPYGPQFGVYTAAFYVSKMYKSKNRWLAGTEVEYQKSIYDFAINNELFTGKERQIAFHNSIFVGHEYLFGRTALTCQLGFYYYAKFLKQYSIYQKIGGGYYIIDKDAGALKTAYIGFNLKTHYSQADFIEAVFSVGF